MPTNNNDRLLVNDGSKTETITFAQFKDGTVLNDSDKFLINDGTTTETITWAQLKSEVGPSGVVNTPTVLKPIDGAGSGDMVYLKSDRISSIEGGGVITCETDTIESVAEYQGNVWTDNPAGFDGGIDTAGNVIDGDINTRTVPASGNDSDYQYGVYIDIQGLLGNYSGPLFSWNNLSGGADKYFAYVIFDDDTESPKVDIYTIPSGAVYTSVYAPTGKNVKTLVLTAKSGNTPASVTKGISTVASDEGLIIADYAGEGSILTFPSSNGFDCFPVGTVVKSGASTTLSETDYNVIFGGSEPTEAYPGASAFTVDFDGDLGFYGNAQMFVNLAGVNGTFNVYGKDKETVIYTSGINSLAQLVDLNVDFERIGRIEWEADYSAGMSYFLAGGTFVNPPLSRPAKVISKDEDANTITVDGGTWINNSEVWSDFTTVPNGVNPSYPIANLYDGDISTFCYDSKNEGTIVLSGVNIPYTQSIRIYSGANGLNASVNGNASVDVSGTNQWKTVVIGPGTLSNLTITAQAGFTAAVAAIEIDGLLLVDPGVGNGDSKLVKETPYGTTLTLSGNTDLDQFKEMLGTAWMSDGTGSPGPYSQTPYKLTTSTISSITLQSQWLNEHQWSTGGFIGSPDGGYPQTWVPFFDNDPATFYSIPTQRNTYWTNPYDALPSTGKRVRLWMQTGVNKRMDDSKIQVSGANEGETILFAPVSEGGPDGQPFWLTISESCPFDITSLSFSGVSTQSASAQGWFKIGILEIDGKPVVDSDISGAPVYSELSFNSPNPDLQYFRDEDIVRQTGAIFGNFVENTYTDNQIYDPDSTGVEWLEAPPAGFDGNPGSQCVGYNEAYSWIYINITTPIDTAVGDVMKIWSSYTSEVRFNKSDSAATIEEGDMGDGRTGVTITSALPASITQIAIKGKAGAAARFARIEINGDALMENGLPAPNEVKVVSVDVDNNRMVVDGGEWSTDPDAVVWSADLTSQTGSFQADRGPELAFNGDTALPACASEDKSQFLKFAPSGGLAFTSTVEIYTHMSGGYIEFNGIQVVSPAGTEWQTLANGPGTINEIVVVGNASNRAVISAIRVDGTVLIDASGPSKVEYQTAGGKGEIVDVDTVNNKVYLTDTTNSDERWIAVNKAGTDFCVAGPSYVDNPLLTNNVWLESSAFSTTPSNNPNTGGPLDALETITWSITPDGGDEMIQVAGVSGTDNPYRPTGLVLSTWHTIKVKHKGLLLGESEGPWSPSTRFKTGSSRSIKEHYLKRIKVLEDEVEDAKTPRRRARNADGTFRGDDPSTPDVNEAWEDGEA